MNDILIFSGTTEGRMLSEGLAARGIPHTVFVATEYGEMMMAEDPLVKVHKGRLDEAAMEELFRGAGPGAKVYDATHPFAVAVTENIRTACEKTGCGYVRILREEGSGGEACDVVRSFPDAEACAEALAEEAGNILLTTGSKELGIFARIPGLEGRLFARVLPSAESIALCNAAGLEGRHIIAMHGPFSKDLNKAVIDQYDISVLVTKAT